MVPCVRLYASFTQICSLILPLPPTRSATQKYSKPIFTEESYQDLQKRQKRAFNTQQLSAFRLLFAWRDKLGRQEDESTG